MKPDRTSATLPSFTGPSLIFLGTEQSAGYAKTGIGISYWRPERCLGQLRLSDETYDLGLPDLTVGEAKARGAENLVIGTANVGGGIPAAWMPTLLEAAEAGLNIVAGLHERLNDNEGLAGAAARGGGHLIDIRQPPSGIPVASGKKRPGKRLLTVGTDCAVGKKYTALALERAFRGRGIPSDFRATGQTGIMIAGSGLPLDATVSDFAAGAAELISPANTEDHWDIIEGQGALTHPAYAGVSLALLHGSQPDAFVLCHEAGREKALGWPDYLIPSLTDCVEMVMMLGRRTNPGIRCVGVSLNTSRLTKREARAALEHAGNELGVPAVDPVAGSVQPILDRALEG